MVMSLKELEERKLKLRNEITFLREDKKEAYEDMRENDKHKKQRGYRGSVYEHESQIDKEEIKRNEEMIERRESEIEELQYFIDEHNSHDKVASKIRKYQ